MRFVSKYAKYMLHARRQIVESYATGESRVIQKQLLAVFEVGLVNAEERALARSHFSFNGFAQEQDLVTIVEPDARISAFDSRLAQAQNGWTDEERELVERELIENARRLPEDLIVMEEIRLAPPWPNYDRFTGDVSQLLMKIEDDGYDLDATLAYERENQNRSDVIYMLEKASELLPGARPSTLRESEEELVG